ncbi:MAG: M20/M25/M40 family metallo-hydrolase [Fimbriimonas sp.]|nr:M20/M25/M40 family metallo-hydrolase [Fimbriimonas sp.]
MLSPFSAFLILQTQGDLVREVRPDLMKEVVGHLSAMPNRNTNNATLTQAAEYIADIYRRIPGLQVEIMKYEAPKSSRVPEAKEVVQVLATLPGETDRRIVIGGHFDSINMQDRSLDAIAPGANDDLSGMSQAIEVARVMAKIKWRNTLVFVAFSGEEQGLFGSRALARRAKVEGWKIDAVLSSDIVGNSASLNGQTDKHHVRVFSEDAPIAGSRGLGSTDNSRELARFIEWNARGKLRGFEPKLVFRRDRYQRGGDHTSFNQEGFSAVRFTEVYEEFTRQHTKDDLVKFVDFNYVENVARLNLITAASLANADPAPTQVRLDPRQAHDTIVRWRPVAGVTYRIYWRDSTSPVWQHSMDVDAKLGEAKISKVNKDDTTFGIGAVGGVPVALE